MKIGVWEVSEMTLMGESAKYLGVAGRNPSQGHFACHKSVMVCVADFAVCDPVDGDKVTPSEQFIVT